MSRRHCLICLIASLLLIIAAGPGSNSAAQAGELLAGVARVDITKYEAGPVNDPLFVKALVLQSGGQTLVLASVDAVAIGEIGYIQHDYLPKVRARLQQELGIPPGHVLVNASHCHGVVCSDVDERTVQAVQAAMKNLAPVRIGAGTAREDRIMENRRVTLKDGRQADVRHAYSFAADEQIAQAGPVDPQIGLLRLDRLDGRQLAVVYNFACHPIEGVPGGGNSADMIGFASRVIETGLDEGALALFLQGCGGDINPAGYKMPDKPRDAEPLGNRLGLAALEGVRRIACRADDRLALVSETIALPRRDQTDRIAALESRQRRLLQSLKGTTLNYKTFVPLLVKYNVSGQFPAAPAQQYLNERAHGRADLDRLDAENRRNLEEYVANIQTMEELVRLQTNLALLRKHQAELVAAGKRTIDVELAALRVGDFVLTTFPGELTVQIGLNIKQHSPHPQTFVAGYTNGYIYYAPTAEQLLNTGYAQEDCDCVLAPEWQEQYETRVAALLKKL
jgi:hypothetical protein